MTSHMRATGSVLPACSLAEPGVCGFRAPGARSDAPSLDLAACRQGWSTGGHEPLSAVSQQEEGCFRGKDK